MEDYLTKLFNLEGKIAALTGAGGHLIGEIGRGLAKAGVKVAILDSRIEKAETVAAEIRDFGGEALAFCVDVRSKGDYQAALREILEKWGDLHIAVNGAGINAPTPFLDISVEEWNEVLGVQLTGTMLGCQVLGGHMVSRKRGAIMNISSASAGPPLSKAYTYSVAKAGIVNLTQNLAREWALANVRVNALRPGFFPTEWNRKNFITPEREAAIFSHTPMNRYGEVGELVGASLWMLSDAASFVTGAEIAVDGGFSAMTI
ncbi:MAG TPA: SDR family oxidoreductase [Tepidisphaeraceae bacterium]|jgi:NAD(P)-dependent dehydrogenase (short-subunit alcohol dehydrogenase family)|nr:SDR family oxidoreductase [Tepidisphaeraceae bacterium]